MAQISPLPAFWLTLLAHLAGFIPSLATVAAADDPIFTGPTRTVTYHAVTYSRSWGYDTYTRATTNLSYVKSGITPTATPTSSFTTSSYDWYYYIRYTEVYMLYPSSVIPQSDLQNYAPKPTATIPERPNSTYSPYDDSDSVLDTPLCGGRRSYSYGSSFGCITLRTLIIILATVIPTLFLLGLVESYFWFVRLMHGKRALRLGTVSWVLLSAWVACFTRVSPSRNCSKEEEDTLRAQWVAFSARQKLRLWLKWGFRHKYPVELLGQDPYTNGWKRRQDEGPLQPAETPRPVEQQVPVPVPVREQGAQQAPEVKNG